MRKSKLDDRIYWNKWYKLNRIRLLKKAKDWRLNNKEKYNLNQKKNREKYPEKKKAHKFSFRKLKIPENTLCVVCKKELAVHKHHPDYNFPEIVMFVCIKCHNKIHTKLKDKRILGDLYQRR